VERKYYADSEDAYEMMKFFKPEAEAKLMKKVVYPLTSTFPGATYSHIDKEAGTAKTEVVNESKQEEKKEGKKKKHKKK